MMENLLAAAHRAAWTEMVVLRRPAPDVIVMSGSTRLDFLQRMSTNDFTGLESGSFRWTVLTTPLARIVDLVQVLARDDDVLLLTSPGRGPGVLEWLRKYVFFRDDLTLQLDATPRQAWLALGPSAAKSAAAISPTASSLQAGEWLQAGEVLMWRVDRPAAGGWMMLDLLPSTIDLDSLALPEEAAGSLYEILRIEAGIPTPDHEITNERIPLELGLTQAISLEKGCYVGQEIIARMTSRDRLARRLVGVRLPGATRPGAVLRQQGSAVGELTSAVQSPSLGWIGLALVRPTALEAGRAQAAVDGSLQPAELVELPFRSSIPSPPPAT